MKEKSKKFTSKTTERFVQTLKLKAEKAPVLTCRQTQMLTV